jgi:hypothetical protein
MTILECIQQLTSDNETTRQIARQTLLSMDEDAVQPLIDEFYAGVNEATGREILQLLGEIGGWEALNTLREVCVYPRYESWKTVAAWGLIHNGQSPENF